MVVDVHESIVFVCLQGKMVSNTNVFTSKSEERMTYIHKGMLKYSRMLTWIIHMTFLAFLLLFFSISGSNNIEYDGRETREYDDLFIEKEAIYFLSVWRKMAEIIYFIGTCSQWRSRLHKNHISSKHTVEFHINFDAKVSKDPVKKWARRQTT